MGGGVAPFGLANHQWPRPLRSRLVAETAHTIFAINGRLTRSQCQQSYAHALKLLRGERRIPVAIGEVYGVQVDAIFQRFQSGPMRTTQVVREQQLQVTSDSLSGRRGYVVLC